MIYLYELDIFKLSPFWKLFAGLEKFVPAVKAKGNLILCLIFLYNLKKCKTSG